MTTIPASDPVARDFADSVGGIAGRLADVDLWRPGSTESDTNPALLARLETLGWGELAVNGELAEVVGPAAFELGRTLAPLDTIDLLLGGALTVRGLSRYAIEGQRSPSCAGPRSFSRAPRSSNRWPTSMPSGPLE